MDGLKCVIPNSCHDIEPDINLFESKESEHAPCPGCHKNNLYKHNGQYCVIMDWDKGKPVEFAKLIKR